jgi:hypothetical protein
MHWHGRRRALFHLLRRLQRRRRGNGDAAARHPRQAHRFLAFLDLDFGEVGFFEQVDQLLYLAQVHGGLWSGLRSGRQRWNQALVSSCLIAAARASP